MMRRFFLNEDNAALCVLAAFMLLIAGFGLLS